MRERLSKIGFLLLVTVLVVGGLTGCERQAAERAAEAPAEDGPESPAASEATPLPGATVVSATTPSTIVEAEPTPGTIVEPAATAPEAEATEREAQPTESNAGEPESAPEPIEPAATSTNEAFVIHKVQSGETVSSIAAKYNTTVEAIVEANNLANASVISVGQDLKIPVSEEGAATSSTPSATDSLDTSSTDSQQSSSGGTDGCRWRHTVSGGEWVYQIARSYGVSPQAIIQANNLTNPSLIQPGTVLCIP